MCVYGVEMITIDDYINNLKPLNPDLPEMVFAENLPEGKINFYDFGFGLANKKISFNDLDKLDGRNVDGSGRMPFRNYILDTNWEFPAVRDDVSIAGIDGSGKESVSKIVIDFILDVYHKYFEKIVGFDCPQYAWNHKDDDVVQKIQPARFTEYTLQKEYFPKELWFPGGMFDIEGQSLGYSIDRGFATMRRLDSESKSDIDPKKTMHFYDRWTGANIAFRMIDVEREAELRALGLPSEDIEAILVKECAENVRFIRNLEHGLFGIIPEKMNFYMDIPAEVGMMYCFDYDKNESILARMENAAKSYKRAEVIEPDKWMAIECMQDKFYTNQDSKTLSDKKAILALANEMTRVYKMSNEELSKMYDSVVDRTTEYNFVEDVYNYVDKLESGYIEIFKDKELDKHTAFKQEWFRQIKSEGRNLATPYRLKPEEVASQVIEGFIGINLDKKLDVFAQERAERRLYDLKNAA